MTRLILITIFILLQSIHCQESYLWVPLLHRTNSTHSSLNIPLTVNQYPYELELSLHAMQDSILSLKDAPTIKNKSNSYDYSKHQDSVYGIIEYYGSRRVDTRLSRPRQLWLNTKLYLWDLLNKQQWIDFRNAPQTTTEEMSTNMADGTISLSNYKQSYFLRSLRKYSQYNRRPLVTFDIGEGKEQGWAYFGSFPIDRLINQDSYGKIKIDNDHQQGWKVSIQELSFLNIEGQDSKLFGQMTFTLSTSERIMQLPPKSIQALASQLPGCSVRQYLGKRLLTCPQQSFLKYGKNRLSFRFKQSKVPLQYLLANMVLAREDGECILGIAQGKVDLYYLSGTFLGEYLMGINYIHDIDNNQGMLLYGKKNIQPLINRFILFKISVFIAIVVLIFSLAVVFYASRIQPSTTEPLPSKKATINESQFYTSSKGGYEMAELTQQSSRDLDLS